MMKIFKIHSLFCSSFFIIFSFYLSFFLTSVLTTNNNSFKSNNQTYIYIYSFLAAYKPRISIQFKKSIKEKWPSSIFFCLKVGEERKEKRRKIVNVLWFLVLTKKKKKNLTKNLHTFISSKSPVNLCCSKRKPKNLSIFSQSFLRRCWMFWVKLNSSTDNNNKK